MSDAAGHHARCPAPWDQCACRILWAADEGGDDPYGLACAYGQFYDPDWDSDPYADHESYNGWSRAYRGATG